MQRSKFWFLKCIFAFLFLIFDSSYSQVYRPGDWVSYVDSRYITSIASDLKTIYFGIPEGILRFDRLTENWEDPITHLGGGSVRLIAVDPISLEPWFLTEEAMAIYNPLSYNFKYYTSLGDISPKEVESIGMNLDGVWVEGGSKMARFDRMRREWESVASFPDEIEWFGKRSPDSLNQYRFLTPFKVKDKKFREYPITALKRDERDLWVGTWGYGIFRYSLNTYLGEHIPYGLAHSNASAMAKEGKDLWFGGSGVTLWRQGEGGEGGWDNLDPDLFPEGVTSILPEPFSTDSVKSSRGRRVWFGTPHGLIRYEEESGFWKVFSKFHGLPDPAVTVLSMDGEEIWIGTRKGLGNISRTGERILSLPELKKLEINDLLVQPDFLWAATSSGVLILNKKEGKWGILDDPDGNTGFGTISIEGDGEIVWFGTRLGLLAYDTKEKRWDRFSSEVFLPNREINDIEADAENLWVGTNDGVARYRKKEGRWQIYTTTDGLLSNIVNAVLLDGDYVFFGTPKGVTRFYWKDPFLRR